MVIYGSIYMENIDKKIQKNHVTLECYCIVCYVFLYYGTFDTNRNIEIIQINVIVKVVGLLLLPHSAIITLAFFKKPVCFVSIYIFNLIILSQ